MTREQERIARLENIIRQALWPLRHLSLEEIIALLPEKLNVPLNDEEEARPMRPVTKPRKPKLKS